MQTNQLRLWLSTIGIRLFALFMATFCIGAGPIGVNVGTPEFVDAMKQAAGYGPAAGGSPVALDASGWPTTDFLFMLMDTRVNMPWNAMGKDPKAVARDESGTYHVSFTGEAVITPQLPEMFEIKNQQHDDKTNITTADMVVPKGQNLIVVSFTKTKGGVKDLRIIRPGFAADTKQVFTDRFLKGLEPFDTLRLMDFLSTNNHSLPAEHAYPAVEEWKDRRLPGDGQQADANGKHGIAWEYGIELGNQSRKNLWINVPIAATDDYVLQLARLLKEKLDPSLVIYVEYSNEVWNFGFCQNWWNAQKAKTLSDAAEKMGGEPKQAGLSPATQYANRSVQIEEIFKSVYGADAIGKTIRPVLAWQVVDVSSVGAMLNYIAARYGPPKRFIYGVANAPYIGSDDCSSVDACLKGMRASADQNAKFVFADAAQASQYGLHMLAYEGGPGLAGADQLAEKIAANRDPRIADVIQYDLLTDWFAVGGELFCQYGYCGNPGQWGSWGIVDDNYDLNNPKYQAYLAIMKAPQPKITGGPTVPAGAAAKLAIDESQYLTANRKPHDIMWLNDDAQNYQYAFIIEAEGKYHFAVGGENSNGGQVIISVGEGAPHTVTLPAAFDETLKPGLHVIALHPKGKGRLGNGDEIVISPVQ